MRARSAQYAALLRPTHCGNVLAAALARMRRYRTHHPHRSCGWLRQAKAAESVIAVPAFYFPAAQPVARIAQYRTIRSAQYAALSRPTVLLRLARKRNLPTRAATKQPDGQNTQNPVQPSFEKYSA